MRLYSRARSRLSRIRATYVGRRKDVFLDKCKNAQPVIILGNQKTGSTAITALLSEATGTDCTLDIKRAIPDVGWQLAVKFGVSEFSDFVAKYRHEFSKKVIKEPSLTFFYDHLKVTFPNARFVFTQRDPFQNIRSILDRLKIPGHLTGINHGSWPELVKTPIWRLSLDSTWLGSPSGTYIEALAHRWKLAAEVYLQDQRNFLLVRYEDFARDKQNSIENLARTLGLPVVNDISSKVNNQFQRKGNPYVSKEEFFGAENVAMISHICEPTATLMGYDSSSGVVGA